MEEVVIDPDDEGLNDLGREDQDFQRPPELTPHGPSPPFKVVSDLFEEISSSGTKRTTSVKPADRKVNYLTRFFELYRARCGKDLFPVVRLLVPDRDRQRSVYGVKEQNLAKLYIDALGLDKNMSADATRLLHWKEPLPGEIGAGDFAEIAFNLIKSRSAMIGGVGRLTIDEVNEQLDQLSRVRDTNDKRRVISFFFKNTTPVEQKWIIRIILKDLKISVRERTVLRILHEDAVALFNVCSDLRRVCWTLWDAGYSLPREDHEVKVFMSFRPMLCKRNEKSLEHIVKSMLRDNPHKQFFIEEKLDGERIQLHMRNGEFRYYSRNDKDYSMMYGKTARDQNGALTKYITSCLRPDVEEVILDGEMMVFDPITKRFTPFGYLKQAAVDKSNDPNKPRACFKVFDILYFKTRGHSPVQLLDYPLHERLKVLKKLVTEKEGYLEYTSPKLSSTAADIRAELDRILDNNGEGLVIKHPNAFYILNGREDSWCKVKPDYMDSLGETFDVTCIGGFWGSGKRGGNFGSFICGVRDETTGDYLSFTKVGSGLSLSHLRDVTKFYQDKWKEMPRKKGQQPPGLKFRSERPDVYIDPADSFVIAIRAAEILTDPDGMAAGLCLRFPRIERIYTRDIARDPLQQLTYGELIGKKDALGSRKRRVTTENLDGHKRRKIAKPGARSKLPALLLGPDLADVTVKSALFAGTTFYVIDGLPKVDKKALEKLVYANGGRFVQAVPNVTPRRVITRVAKSLQGRKLIEKGHTLVSPQWLVDCDEQQQLLPLEGYYTHQSETPELDDGDLDATEDEHDEMEVDKTVAIDDDEGEETQDSPEFASLKDVRRAIPDSEDEDEEGLAGTGDTKAAAAGIQAADASWGDTTPSSSPARPARGVPIPLGDVTDDEDEPVQQRYIAPAPAGMGADEPGMRDYDPDLIFKPLVFFFDTKEHAGVLAVRQLKTRLFRSTEMVRQLPHSSALPAKHPIFVEVAGYLKKSGGRMVDDLTDPSITHIVFAKKDTSRMSSLRHLSDPKLARQRRLVTTNWIVDCFQEDTLLPEQDYAPPLSKST